MENFQQYIDLLKRELVPALGCTEPIAVALSTSKCKDILGGRPEKIIVYVSRNILKNGMGVGIPGTGKVGLHIAGALGAICGDSEAGLEVLKNVNKDNLLYAESYINQGNVDICLKETESKLYVEAVGYLDEKEARVIIKDRHNKIVFMSLGNEVLFKDENFEKDGNIINNKSDMQLTIKKIYEFSTKVDFKDICFLLEGAEMNRRVAQEGIEKDYGLKVGKTFYRSINEGIWSDSIESYALALTAAAVDARMDGCILPVMSTAGSGNQGLTATLPVVAVAEKLKLGEEKLGRALAISNLVTIHIKSYIGRLSALCGCGVAASIGASCGMTYLLGGNFDSMVHVIKNMIADISGIICDGAKRGCALKISTAVSAAIQCSILAINNIEVACSDGIIHDSVEQTIKNLGELGSQGMVDTDKIILDMMVCK